MTLPALILILAGTIPGLVALYEFGGAFGVLLAAGAAVGSCGFLIARRGRRRHEACFARDRVVGVPHSCEWCKTPPRPLPAAWIQATIGLVSVLPLFVWWAARVTLRELHHWDATITARLVPSQVWARRAWLLIARAGDGWVYAFLIVRDRRMGEHTAAYNLAVAVAVAWGLSGLVKLIVRRRRPHQNPRSRPAMLFTRLSLWSFPSSHAAVAVAAAFAIGRPWAALFAAAVSASRIGCAVHYVGDVTAGVLIGCGVGWWV